MASNSKKISIDQFFIFFNIAVIILISLFVIESAAFIPLCIMTGKTEYAIAYIIVTFVLVVLVSIISILFYYKFKSGVFNSLYRKTLKNYSAIANQNNDLELYNSDKSFLSFDDLDDSITHLQKVVTNSIVYTGKLDYENIGLNFENGRKIVPYDNFVNSIHQIIFSLHARRAALISFTYQIKDKKITDNEINNFYTHAMEIFTYPNVVAIDNSDNYQLLLFVPGFDSYDRLKEEVAMLIDDSSITRYAQEGQRALVPHAGVVVYPCSEIDNIFFDLEYANRQNELINFYIPNNVIKDNTGTYTDAANFNFVSYMHEQLSNIDPYNENKKTTDKKITDAIKKMRSFYRFDDISVFVFNENDNKYEHLYHDFNAKKPSNITIDDTFIDILNNHIDDDNSYFFSSRKHVSQDVGKFFDVYEMESGFLYLIKKNDKPVGAVLFLKHESINIDPYLQEALLIFSNFIKAIVLSSINRNKMDMQETEINNLLLISNLKSYTVDKETYDLLSFSNVLADMIPDIKVGEKCYKALYNRNKPCASCPLLKKKKMIEKIAGLHYESSLVLNKPKQKEVSILLTPADENLTVREKYDSDLLVNTHYSLLQMMRDYFEIASRGHFVYVNIDNNDELYGKLKTEEYNMYLREFFNAVKKELLNIKEIYYIPNRSFAFVLPDGQRKTTIETIEKINAISKRNFNVSEEPIELHLTYFSHTYPNGYQNSDEYIRYITSISETPIKYLCKDMIIMPEKKHIRSASHKEFVTDVLNNSLSAKTFDVRLQPIVVRENKRINGAEMLLRVSDSFLGSEMNTLEIINAASENNKIALITDILIEKIGSLYKEYEERMFKRYNVQHLSLNTDYSFFQDASFLDKIMNLENTYNVPKNFLIFEIQESEIAHHYKEFEEITQIAAKNEITLMCDNYSGKYLPVSKIKELGFKGIKFDRSVISSLKDNEEAMTGIVSAVNQARELSLDTVMVGIEFKEQYNLLKELKQNDYFQGYYFYRPLSAEELINALITANN